MAGVIRIKTRGTVLHATVETDFRIIEYMSRDMNFRMAVLSKFSKRGRRALQRRYLSSPSSISSVKYKNFGKSRGRYKVSGKAHPRGIVFTSFPLNPFEHGRTYKGVGVDRSRFARKQHIKDPARRILTVKFRDYLHVHIQAWGERAIARTVVEFEKAG